LLQEREDLGTTALGNGIAFPHCKSNLTDRFVGVAGFLNSRVPFDAIDGDPVDSVFLVLAPQDQRERFVEILGRLVAIGRDKRLGTLLRGCRTAEHVSSFLDELDQSVRDDVRGAGKPAPPSNRAGSASWTASGPTGQTEVGRFS